MSIKRSRDATKSVRVEDVARLAGVSPITVSRALSTPDLVREETRRRVEDAVKKTGYVVNRFASTLRSGRSSIVAVFVSSLKDPEIALSMQGLVDAFDGSNYQMLFAQPPRSATAQDQDVLSVALPFRPAGLAFSGPITSMQTRRSLVEHQIPVVEMGTDGKSALDMSVGISEHDSGRALGAHLGAQGFRKALFCGDKSAAESSRLAGFRAGFEAMGGRVVGSIEARRSASLNEAKALFDEAKRVGAEFDALLAGDDLTAEGCLLRAIERQILVPHALGIASLGLGHITGTGPPGVTTLAGGGYEIGLAAGRLLLGRLDGGAGRGPVELPLAVHVAASTNRHPVPT